jgi:S-adenosylmethionine:tRNA ribosyltransferase-isomerase
MSGIVVTGPKAAEAYGKQSRARNGLGFDLPAELSAGEPPEARGLARDGVRLMLSEVEGDRVRHAAFRELPELLSPGDLLVVNESATINAALDAIWESGDRAGEQVALHLSTPLPGGSGTEWIVELREPTDEGTRPLTAGGRGDRLRLAAGARALLREPYPPRGSAAGPEIRGRLWIVELSLPGEVLEFTERHGQPIRYRYVGERWPLAEYQTVFAKQPGSAEMPSAGRPFTRAMIERLERRRIMITRLVLHTGVASLEVGEPPYPERYQVPKITAEAVNVARRGGRRVIAVGTTVVRALETVTQPDGHVNSGVGWTGLVITPARGIRSVDGILTGLHEPTSSHLAMLEAFAGRPHLEVTYRAALEERYLWHEFGDLHLVLRPTGGGGSPSQAFGFGHGEARRPRASAMTEGVHPA